MIHRLLEGADFTALQRQLRKGETLVALWSQSGGDTTVLPGVADIKDEQDFASIVAKAKRESFEVKFCASMGASEA